MQKLLFWSHRWIRNNSTFYVAAPIFYVNAAPHLGHLYTAVLADAIQRFHCLRYPNEKNVFSIGTDEHGLKIQKSALSHNIDVHKYCDNIAENYRKLFDLCDIQYTHFIRTTSPNHINAVQNFWNTLKNRGHIYLGEYSGWYCIPDETFLSQSQLNTITSNDGSNMKVSLESGHPVEWSKEENYMFKLSDFKTDLLHWLNDYEKRIVPSKFYHILKDWISNEEYISDISVSRPTQRIHWGIPVPNDQNQTIYVWLDALVNYLTAIGYPDNFKTWPPTVHVCGKDILKFHGVYWPAFLMAAGLEPPKQLFVHSHWTVNYEKMSKSKNNVIDPYEKIQKYSVSGIRYFLLKDGVPHSDGNYSEMKIFNLLNADLANTLGNLLNRCCSKSLNPSQQFPCLNENYFEKMSKHNDVLSTLTNRLSELSVEVEEHYSEFNFYKGIEIVISTLHATNKFFESCKPWELKKSNDPQMLDCVLHITMESLRICAIALWPIIPDVSDKLLNKLNISIEDRKWNYMVASWDSRGNIKITQPLSLESVLLYEKIKN